MSYLTPLLLFEFEFYFLIGFVRSKDLSLDIENNSYLLLGFSWFKWSNFNSSI